jgi:hypothetical protein
MRRTYIVSPLKTQNCTAVVGEESKIRRPATAPKGRYAARSATRRLDSQRVCY